MMQTRQLFGTDGIRGVAGEFPLTSDSVYWIGRALGHDLMRVNAKARVVIGQDTRASSRWIADRFLQGLASVGVEARSAGVITTPGVAFLARSQGFDAGVVISASHNPWTDNGIKIFSGDGYKLPDARELAIEKEIFALLQSGRGSGAGFCGRRFRAFRARRVCARLMFAGSRAAFLRVRLEPACVWRSIAPMARRRPRLRSCSGRSRSIRPFCIRAPDGQEHQRELRRAASGNGGALCLRKARRSRTASIFGVTFDGDADRALFCDADGTSGERRCGAAARRARHAGPEARSRNDTVVATTMSNMGLELALKRSGIQMLRANVGDKYVLEEMQRVGATLGGEQSGHILFRDGEATTGDGLLTALRVMEIMVRTGKPLADLVGDLKVFPQTIRNVRVRQKTPFAEIPPVQAAIAAAEGELDGNGRVVVRYSGTEALARVMIEAESKEQMDRLAESIVGAIRLALGMQA